MFCVRYDHITSIQSRGELLSEQPDILRESFSTILKQHRQKYPTVKAESQEIRNKQTKKKTNTPLNCPDLQVSSPPTVSKEFCPGTPQPDRSCNTQLMKKTAGFVFKNMCFHYVYLPVVQKRLRIFENVF